MATSSKVLKKGAYHHGDLRQQLVNALAILIEEQGATGFSVSEACRRAGVSTAAPYRHFTDRDDMLRAVATDAKQRMAAAFRAAASAHPHGSAAAVFAIGKAYLDFADAQPNVFRLVFSLDDEEFEDLRCAGEECGAVVDAQVAAYLGLPVDHPGVMRVSFPLWTFVHGLAFMKIDRMLERAHVGLSVDDVLSDAGARLLGPPGPR